MWSKLGDWLKRAPRAKVTDVDRHLALAVLMVEAARADFERSPAELALIRDTLAASLSLSAAEAEELLQKAVTKSETAISLYEFVSVLNDELDADEKEQLIGWLWQIAHADGRLDPQEEGLIRRMAELLYVPHGAMVRQRLESIG